MKLKYTVVLMTLASVNVFAARSTELNPQGLHRDIEKLGAEAVVNNLYASNRWDTVMARIGSGNAAWLALAGDLAKGTDAGASEALTVSVAQALPKNPESVLKLVGTDQKFQFDSVCSAPFIEPEKAFMKRYLKEARRALGKIKNPELESKRAACLDQIKKADDYVRTH